MQTKDKLHQLGANSVRFAIAFHKKNPENLKFNFYADYIGFIIPKKFVIGYGLDYD